MPTHSWSTPQLGSTPALQADSETESDLLCLESLFHHRTGEHLNDLQRVILRLGLKGKRYLEIADVYGCTEGHAKDVGAQLWRALSRAMGEKVTKQNLRSAVARCVQRARRLKHQATGAQLSSHLVSNLAPEKPLQFLDPAAPRLFQWSWEKPS